MIEFKLAQDFGDQLSRAVIEAAKAHISSRLKGVSCREHGKPALMEISLTPTANAVDAQYKNPCCENFANEVGGLIK